MLNQLTIKNLAIVENINLDFKKNLTILTGETGAGKSIILSSINLLIGNKTKQSMVRKDAEKAEILGSFDISKLELVKKFLIDNNLTGQEDECILRRIINKDGKSICYINDVRVSLNQMKLIGELLINIHGQNDNQLLTKKKNQILLLDEYINNKDLLEELKIKYKKWKNLKTQLFELKNNFQENHAKKELLSYQYNEIEKLDLIEGEIPLLEEELKTLESAHLILNNGSKAYSILEENENSVSNNINEVIYLIKEMNKEIKELDQIEKSLESIQIEIEELNSSIINYLNKIEVNPERLSFVEKRLNNIYSLSKKHFETPENLYHFQNKLKEELDKLSSCDISLEELEKKLIIAKEDYIETSKKVSSERKTFAKKMSIEINNILEKLKLPKNMFSIEIKTEDKQESHFNENGIDDICFYIEPNIGEEKKPLSETASGGELSRISLAIQVVALKNKNTPTIIFDEIDTGVSGEVANIIGNLLVNLSLRGQVFCITHIPQVAAKGNNHYLISKKIINEKTYTEIDELSNDDRVKEIAQMLGGSNLTKESWEHAKKLLEKTIGEKCELVTYI